jgi:hypothetical protein
MSAYGRINPALQGRRVDCLVWMRKGGGYVVQHSGRGRARSIPASGTERRAAEWNQSRICADFGHAVSLCRMIASLRFSGGAFDVIGTTTWWQSGHWVKASSSPAYISLCAQNGLPLSRAKWPFLKRIMRAAQADVHMVEVPLWPVRAALCMKELRRSFRMLASCMGGPLSWRG